jgi:hypothetical protein
MEFGEGTFFRGLGDTLSANRIPRYPQNSVNQFRSFRHLTQGTLDWPEGNTQRVIPGVMDLNRQTIRFGKLKVLGGIVALSLLAAEATFAQAPSGPITAAPSQAAPVPAPKPVPLPPPRTTILGAWKFDADDSDDPNKRRREPQDSNGGYGGGRGRVGGGYPGGGHGGYGGRHGGGESDEERQKMRELFTPAKAITLSMTGAEVDLVDDRDRKRAFMTDGRKLKKSKDENYQEIAAKFEGNRLVSDEKDPRGNKMSRTFELSSDGRQLYETVHMTSGRSNTPRVVRYVYDLPAQTVEQSKQ